MTHPLPDLSASSARLPHIVFLFSDTGGGHRSAATAIIEALELRYPNQCTTEMVDVFRSYAPPPLHHAPEIYPPLTRVPRAWGMGFYLSDGPKRTRFGYRLLWPYIRWGLIRLVREHPADLYVSVHQWFNVPMTHALSGMRKPTPFAIVVTDLVTTHAAWYAPQANQVIVPTPAAFQRGLRYDIDPHRMQIIGLPVAERFRTAEGADLAAERRATRERLGWPQDRPMALLVGGGEGMGPLEATARAIQQQIPSNRLGLAIVVGRNKKLKERLEKSDWGERVKLYGFVTDMPDLMRAADILITKAGPGTISEAFIAGLPMILYSRLNGQEDGNVVYVVDHGAGVWAPRPQRVVEALQNWLDHPARCEQAKQACLTLARPDASRQIAQVLMEQIGRAING